MNAQRPKESLLNEQTIEDNTLSSREYKYGFYTDIATERIPKGLNEKIIGLISEKKGEPDWMRTYRLKAFAYWKTLKEPRWPNFIYGPIDYQAISYYSAPKGQKDSLKSLDEADPELLKTFAQQQEATR